MSVVTLMALDLSSVRANHVSRVLIFFLGALPALPMSLTVEPSNESPAPVGTVVNWNATVTGDTAGTIWYRYRVRTPGAAEFRTVRDFSPEGWFQWVPVHSEGQYDIEITARDLATGDTESTTFPYLLTSRVTGDTPVITPTFNQLVFLYSAPPCAAGSRLQVQSEAPDGFRQFTHAIPCTEGASVNVYLAGLRADTEYKVKHTVTGADGVTSEGPVLTLRTDPLPFTPALTQTLRKPSGAIAQSVLLQSKLDDYHVATDIDGNVIWYGPPDIRYLTRPEPGGYFVALFENSAGDDSAQILRVIDLAGNVVLETNAARINEQLDALGITRMTSFHHEARLLPSGKILALAGTERILRDVQDPGDVDVIGDIILVLNRDLEVEWAWDAFEHLDVTRKAVLDEKCTPNGGGCPVMRLATRANDWLHGNSLQLTPDGNILYSARHQDWIIKIDYANGQGSGDVIWRLGKDGDFRIVSSDPSPWFSHQHDANYEKADMRDRIVLFDNGNTRQAVDKSIHSRGQVLQIDERSRIATLVVNIDLGDFSRALGSAQKMTNGNYHFDLGWMTNGFSQALEFDPAGRLVTKLEVETTQYRSFRMRDLYTPQ